MEMSINSLLFWIPFYFNFSISLMKSSSFLLPFIVSYFLFGLISGNAQKIIFETGFNNTLQSSDGDNPANSFGGSFTNGLKAEGLLAGKGDILQYDISNNIIANEGSLTLWVKPNWLPGDILRRILVVESSPVFELHVDESANLVFAMFSDQIETRIASGYVGGWNIGDWHFVSLNWSADRIEIYSDGIRIAAMEVGFEIPTFGEGVFNLGSLAGENAFNGVLDELTIYDAPLSDTQINQQYESTLADLPSAAAIRIIDKFGRDVTDPGMTLVDWEGPVRNPAMKYLLQGNDSLSYPLSIALSTSEENTSFGLPSTISPNGPTKSIVLDSKDSQESFLFSFYMDENFEDESFDLTLTYNFNGLPVQQAIPVKVIDQDIDRSLTYPIIVDFSLAIDPLLLDDNVQSIITEAAEDWLYYVDGSSFDTIPAGASSMVFGGQDHNFEENEFSNPVPYVGYYLYAFENTVSEGCVCSTGFPNRGLFQTSNGEYVPIFRFGGLHLNLFGQAFETEPTGWEVERSYDNWTQEGHVGSDMYTLAKHEIGHALVFEELPLFLKARERGGFISSAISDYYPGGIVPLFPNEAHLPTVLDPASQSTPYGGSVDVEVMPLGREMLTKLDILIMESVGYPLRENEVTKAVSLSSEDAFNGDLEMDFSANLIADGGIPVYHYSLSSGMLPAGLSLNSMTGRISGIPEEDGEFPVIFLVKDYDERSQGATLTTTIRIGNLLSSEAQLLSYDFDTSTSIVEMTVDSSAQTIYFLVESRTDITNLTPQIEISEGATIAPSIGESQDFTDPVAYTITSEDGTVLVTWTIIIDVVLSVEDKINQIISLYPNPANHVLMLDIFENSVGPSEVKLFNAHGLFMKHTYHYGKTVSIPLHDISPGLYFLRVSNQNGIISTHKVVIQH